MYTPKQITEAALTAALSAVATLEQDPTKVFVTTEQLIAMSGLVPPTDTDLPSVHKQWGFNLMSLREQWRHLVLDQAGRWPKTVRGVGFEILEPPKNIQHADTKVLRDVVQAIRKGKRIIRSTRNDDLTSQERRQKINSELRFSQLEGASVSAQAQAERERTWRDDPTSETPQQPPTQTQPQDDS
jgi:hypothetical protein